MPLWATHYPVAVNAARVRAKDSLRGASLDESGTIKGMSYYLLGGQTGDARTDSVETDMLLIDGEEKPTCTHRHTLSYRRWDGTGVLQEVQCMP
jgi:hypothetical protein